MKITKVIITVAAIFSAAIMVTSCGKKNAKDSSADPEQTYAVSTLTTTAGNLDDYLEFGGDIASVNSVAVLPDQGGKVTNILVSVGDMVKKGQTIAYVNPLRVGAVFNDNCKFTNFRTHYITSNNSWFNSRTVITNCNSCSDR